MLKYIIPLMMCFIFTQSFAADKSLASKFRTAVFWNDGTAIVPDETPAGYKRPDGSGEFIGDFTKKSGDDLTNAPEIGRSALKLFLTALDDKAGYTVSSPTLDTAGIRAYVEDNKGVIDGAATPVLPNVRIYSIYDDITLAEIKEDFGGELPEVITVINSGGDLKQSDLDNMNIDEMLFEACKEEVGVFLLGSASTSFAVAIDKICEKNGIKPYFAVKGIQKAFNVQSYKGSLLFDFDLTGDIKQDSVVLRYDGTKYYINKVSSVKFNPSTDKYSCDTGDVIYEVEGKNAPTKNDLHSGIKVTTHWGQFVIEGAKAQSVISYDSYGPDMNSGVNYASAILGITSDRKLITTEEISADVIREYSGNVLTAGTVIKEAGTADEVGVVKPKAYIKTLGSDGKTWGEAYPYVSADNLIIPNVTPDYGTSHLSVITTTEVLAYSPSKPLSPSATKEDSSLAGTKYCKPTGQGGGTYPVDSEWRYRLKANDTVVVWSQNKTWGKKDSIGCFVVTEIKESPEGYEFTFTEDFVINNSRIFYKGEKFQFENGYEMVYPKSGYTELTMDMMDISGNGNSEIFKRIFQISALTETESIPFKKWENNGRIQCAAEIWAVNENVDLAQFKEWYGTGGSFNPDKYYFGRFSQQFAKGTGEFYSLTENAAKDGFKREYFNALPDDAQEAFKDKEYYTLSVIQHGHQRVAIAGYQPQYVEDIQKSIDIITDLFIWSAKDDSRMPPGVPSFIKGSEWYKNNDTIPTDVEKLAVVIDFTLKDDDIYTDGYTFTCDIEYEEGTKFKTLTLADNPTVKKGNKVDTLFFDISSLIDPKEVSKTTIKVAKCIVWPDGGNVGRVEESTPKSVRYDIQKLVAEFIGTSTGFLVTADVKVKSEQFIAGTGSLSTAKDLPSGTPTVFINGDSGPSIHKITIDKSQTVKAHAEMAGYVNSDEISRDYDKGSLTFPAPVNTVPEDSIVFVTDSVGLKVVLDPDDDLVKYDARYKIEWAVEYDGSIVATGTGKENDSVMIAVKDFVDRSKTSVTTFKLTGKTVSMKPADFKDSDDATYNYSVKKLETDPNSATTIKFKGKESLTVEALYNDVEVDSADIVYIMGTTQKSVKSGKSTDEFATSVDITFWAEDTMYINSDKVSGYKYEKEDIRLPKPKPTKQPGDVNGKDKYLFFNDTSIFLTLETFVVEEVLVTDDAYTIDYTLNGVTAAMADTGAIDLTLTFIDQLIAAKATKLEIGAKCVSEDTDFWLHGESMETKAYEFRTVDVVIEDLTNDADADKIDIKLTAKDPITAVTLTDGVFYYTVDGSTPDKTKSGPVTSGSTITVDNGVVVRVVAYRSGYISGTGQGVYTKDAVIIADPKSGTFFGEKLDVTLTSNLSPIFYTIDGGATQKFDATSGTMTLDDALSTLIRDDDTVKIHAWVEGNNLINGTQADFVYYRRKLAKVVIDPKSGNFKSTVNVSMTCSDNQDYIFYDFGAIAKPSISYVDEFVAEPKPTITITAQARAEGWLDSDTTQVTYNRLASISDAAYYDANADGIIDSAVISLESNFEGLVIPDSIICELPNGDEKVTIKNDTTDVDTTTLITFDAISNKIAVSIVGFSTILTGFDAGEYIQLKGSTYDEGSKTIVSDSVAPVIKAARYAPGPQDQSGVREYDVLTVEFTEELTGLSISESTPDQLFTYGGGLNIYTGSVSTQKNDGATYTFHVTELTGVTFPSKGDSIWIDVDAITDVIDTRDNIQDNKENRRVEMTVEKLPIRVEVRAFWMKDVIINKVPAFNGITSPDQIPALIMDESGASGASFDIGLGGFIIIDPKIPFAVEDARDFKAEIAVLDAVGNEVISTGAVYDKSNGHLHAMPAFMTFMENGKSVSRWVIAAAWDGRNASGRDVHARTFKVMTLSEWPGIDGAISADGVIPVFKLSEE